MADRRKNTQIFREKAIDRISSPENLDQYIKTTKPSLWLVLIAVIIALVGILVWACVTKVPSQRTVGVVVDSGVATIYLSEAEYANIKTDSYVEIDGRAMDIKTVDGPTLLNKDSNQFMREANGLSEGDWYYTLAADTSLQNGEYKGKVVFELISPIEFILN